VIATDPGTITRVQEVGVSSPKTWVITAADQLWRPHLVHPVAGHNNSKRHLVLERTLMSPRGGGE
jgi:hypothetical protein